MRYSAIGTENQSPEAKEATYRSNALSIDNAVKEGKLTQVQADQNKAELVESLKHDDPPNKYSVVLSCRNGKLLFRTVGAAPSVFIWDGKNSYAYDARENGFRVKSGFGFRAVAELPCPGAGLPEIPLLKLSTSGVNNFELRGDLYTDYIQGLGPQYMPGILRFESTKEGGIRLIGGEWRYNGELRGRYEFSGVVNLDKVPIARQIRFIQYSSEIHHALGTDPAETHSVKYELVSFSNKALPEDQFNPTSYIPVETGTHPETSAKPFVQWTVSNETVTFRHDPAKTMEQQAAELLQAQKLDAHVQSTRESKRTGVAGPILLVLLFAGAVWWLIRRRGSSTR